MSILIGLVIYFHSFKSLGGSQFIVQMIIQICLTGGYVDATLASRKSAAEALANVDDVRMIDALTVCLDISDSETKKIVRSALVRLLPRVKASDDLKLINESYEQLLSELKTGEKSLKLAILKALEQIGDEKAISVVEYLAANAWDAEVRTAARDCLPALRHRSELCRLANTLLRPAESLQTDSDILLRPAKGMAIEHEHLLRTIE
jgi:HEAT repeat protein